MFTSTQRLRGGAFAILLIPIAILAIFIAISVRAGVSFNHFSGDPAAISHMPFYLGMLSNVGILCWTSAAAICFFTAFLLRNTNHHPAFFLHAGLLTTLLLLDDLFMLHEEVFPRYFGIREMVVHLALMTCTATILFHHRKFILETRWGLLAAALLLFACSVGVDGLIGSSSMNKQIEFMIEDGPKFVGIFAWAAYLTGMATAQLRPQPAAATAPIASRDHPHNPSATGDDLPDDDEAALLY